MDLLISPYPQQIPANSFFYVNNTDVVKQLPLNLISVLQKFFNFYVETNKLPLPQSNFEKWGLVPHDFARNFYLI